MGGGHGHATTLDAVFGWESGETYAGMWLDAAQATEKGRPWVKNAIQA